MARKPKLVSTEQPHSEPEDAMGLERLVFFSDAVFAIAITLLALEIRLPASESELSNGELFDRLLSIWPHYLAYAISFLVIGTFWMGHHRKFRFIRRYDSTLILLNLLLLMVVAFIPFPTAVLSEYGNRTATIFYALTMVMVGLLSAMLWWYAVTVPRLVEANLALHQRRREFVVALALAAVFLLSVGLAWIDDDLAKFSWLLLIPVTLYLR